MKNNLLFLNIELLQRFYKMILNLIYFTLFIIFLLKLYYLHQSEPLVYVKKYQIMYLKTKYIIQEGLNDNVHYTTK